MGKIRQDVAKWRNIVLDSLLTQHTILIFFNFKEELLMNDEKYILYVRPITFDGAVKRIDVIDMNTDERLNYTESDKDTILEHFINESLVVKTIGRSSYLHFVLSAITVSSNEEEPYMIFTFEDRDHKNSYYKTKIFSK